MPRKPKSIPIPVTENSPHLSKQSIGRGLLKIFFFAFYLAFWFSSEICINPLQWLVAMVLRFCIFYFFMFPYQDKIGNYFTLPDGHMSIFVLPIALFYLWYFFTSFIMFLGAIYGGFGRVTSQDETPAQGDFPEIERFKKWRDNKMRFSSYEESAQLLRDSSVINNLDPKDPEARKTLSYINNKLKFLSYTAGLEFLRGRK